MSPWYVRDLLPLMGARVADGPVVSSHNRLTATGVSAGLDLGLYIVAQLAGEDAARRIDLLIQHNPMPPFGTGSPDRAGAALTDGVRRHMLEVDA